MFDHGSRNVCCVAIMACFVGWRRDAKPSGAGQPTSAFAPKPRKIADFGEFKLGKTLGSGQFGKVKQAENVNTGALAAVKIIPNGKMDETALQNEVALQRKLDHPHIVKVFEVVATEQVTYIAMELVSGGDLLEHLLGFVRLEEDEARRLFQQIIVGIEHCHSRKICHRDLKPENILVDSEVNVKIADFGLAAEIVEGEWLLDSCGSPNYAAPELLSRGCKYKGPEIDVWSTGVILYALLCNSLPFDADSVPELFKKIKRGTFAVPGFVRPDVNGLLKKILNVKQEERISIAGITANSWFRKKLPQVAADAPPDVPVAPPELAVAATPSQPTPLTFGYL